MSNGTRRQRNLVIILYGIGLIPLLGSLSCGGRTPSPCVDAPARNAKWSFKAASSMDYPPSIDPATGVIYVSTREDERDGGAYLYAIDPTGAELWRFDTNGSESSATAIGPEGTIYFGTDGSANGRLWAVNSDGSLQWTFALDGCMCSSPSLASDGTVYVGDALTWGACSRIGEGFVYAIDPDGKQKWRVRVGALRTSQELAVGADGTIYTGGPALVAISPQGEEKWRFTGIDGFYYSPSVDSNGTVYVGVSVYVIFGPVYTEPFGPFYALSINPDGSEAWRLPLDDRVEGAPSVGPDGTVYLGTDHDHGDHRVYAVNPNGTVKWRFQASTDINGTPAVGSDGTLYAGGEPSELYTLSSATGDLSWCFQGATDLTSPLLGSGGTLYVASEDGTVYSIDGDSPGPADSDWPMFGHDAQHTHRVGGP